MLTIKAGVFAFLVLGGLIGWWAETDNHGGSGSRHNAPQMCSPR